MDRQAQTATARTTGLAAINGTRLWFEDGGDGLPVVLIHGSPLDARMWDLQIEDLSRRHRVVRYDVRGYGRSQTPDSTPYRHEDDLAGLLALLDIDRAAVVGLSMGGRLAVDFALAYPAAVSSLVLAGSSLSGFPWTEDVAALAHEVTAAWRDAGADAARQIVLGRHWFQTVHPRPEITDRLQRMIGGYSGWHWQHADPVIAPRPAAHERLEALMAPALVIVGEHDHPDIQQVAAALVARMPAARYLSIRDAGHMVNMEQPEQFNQAVLAFLAECEAQTETASSDGPPLASRRPARPD